MGAFSRAREQLQTVAAAANELPRHMLVITLIAAAGLLAGLVAIAVALRTRRLAAAGG